MRVRQARALVCRLAGARRGWATTRVERSPLLRWRPTQRDLQVAAPLGAVHSRCNERADLLQDAVADDPSRAEIINDQKWCLPARGDDLCCRRRTNAWQCVELLCSRGVQINLSTGGGCRYRARYVCCRDIARGGVEGPAEDPLHAEQEAIISRWNPNCRAVRQWRSKVETDLDAERINALPPSTSGSNGINQPRSGRERVDTRDRNRPANLNSKRRSLQRLIQRA